MNNQKASNWVVGVISLSLFGFWLKIFLNFMPSKTGDEGMVGILFILVFGLVSILGVLTLAILKPQPIFLIKLLAITLFLIANVLNTFIYPEIYLTNLLYTGLPVVVCLSSLVITIRNHV